MEQLALNCFNNNFRTDTGTTENNIPLLDDVYDEDTVSTLLVVNFPSYDDFSAHVRTIYNLTINTDSSPASKKNIYAYEFIHSLFTSFFLF